jgi:hypothetical protein
MLLLAPFSLPIQGAFSQPRNIPAQLDQSLPTLKHQEIADPRERRSDKSQNEEFYDVRGDDRLTRYGLRPGSALAQNAIECKAPSMARANGRNGRCRRKKISLLPR